MNLYLNKDVIRGLEVLNPVLFRIIRHVWISRQTLYHVVKMEDILASLNFLKMQVREDPSQITYRIIPPYKNIQVGLLVLNDEDKEALLNTTFHLEE